MFENKTVKFKSKNPKQRQSLQDIPETMLLVETIAGRKFMSKVSLRK